MAERFWERIWAEFQEKAADHERSARNCRGISEAAFEHALKERVAEHEVAALPQEPSGKGSESG